MQAGREDALAAVAGDDRVEDRPDAVVARDDCLQLGLEVARRARLEQLQRGVVRTVQEQAVLGDEVGQQLVQRIRARRRVERSVLRARSGDQVIEGPAPGLVRCDRRALGRACHVDSEPLAETPENDAGPQGAQREAAA